MGTKMNRLGFEVKRSKVKVTARPKCGHVSALGGGDILQSACRNFTKFTV